MQGKPVAEQEIGKQLLLETVAYAESSLCRPKLLLNYFGEVMKEGCGNCDNCLHPKEKFEGKEDVRLSLKAILSGAANDGFFRICSLNHDILGKIIFIQLVGSFR